MSYLSRLHHELNHSEGEMGPQENIEGLNNYNILDSLTTLISPMLKFFYILFPSL